MEYKIIDLVFPILVHFLALQLTGILDPVDHRDRGGGRAEYPVFGTDVVSGIGLWDYQ